MPENELSTLNFHGNFRHGIDESRRVMLPSKWRPEDPNLVFRVIAWPITTKQYLLVLPPQRWQLMLSKLQTNKMQDPRVAAFERTIGKNSAAVTLDKAGRLCLPENLIQLAGLEREAEFVGRLDKFEIWSPTRLQATAANDEVMAASVADELDL